MYKTEQEEFWTGRFGDEYIGRNSSINYVISNIHLFSKILSRTNSVDSFLEFGANVGLNLRAIHQLMPFAKLHAIEINQKAASLLTQKMQDVKVYNQSVLDALPNLNVDFVLIKGVLIHINPSYLKEVYEKLYKASSRYICIVEYYNPTPVEVSYRGHEGKLFKRDFAGEMLDIYSNLKLVDYGFVYHRDYTFPADDLTWFLLEKI